MLGYTLSEPSSLSTKTITAGSSRTAQKPFPLPSFFYANLCTSLPQVFFLPHPKQPSSAFVHWYIVRNTSLQHPLSLSPYTDLNSLIKLTFLLAPSSFFFAPIPLFPSPSYFLTAISFFFFFNFKTIFIVSSWIPLIAYSFFYHHINTKVNSSFNIIPFHTHFTILRR